MREDSISFDEILNKDSFRRNLVRHSLRALHEVTPFLDDGAKLLDLGCGTGVPTIELAVTSGLQITALDRDRRKLRVLRDRIRALRLDQRISVQQGDIRRPRFRKSSFDVLWSEGSMVDLGLAAALKGWSPLLRPKGFLVVHEGVEVLDAKESVWDSAEFDLLKRIDVGVDQWVKEYYRPLERKLDELTERFGADRKVMALIGAEREEVALLRANPRAFSSCFVVARRRF